MKSKDFIIGLIIVLFVFVIVWFFATYNSFILKDEAVKNQWAQVETQYQRRIDLIPNLVSTTKGFLQFESTLLQNITALRTQWMDAKSTEDKIDASNKLDSAISRLLVTYENYPELKSVEVVKSLMDELAGTENRISVERKRYNDVVNEYNVAVKTFPSNIVADWTGHKEKKYYESVQGAEQAPVVKIY
jgi:LemA protein